MPGLAIRKLSDPGLMQECPGDLGVLSYFCALLLKMNAKSYVTKGQLFQFCFVIHFVVGLQSLLVVVSSFFTAFKSAYIRNYNCEIVQGEVFLTVI